MKTSYFAQGTGFIAVTDKSPKDFAGVLFIGKGGLTLDSISEQVFAPADVKALQPVPKDGMPEDWLLAFGYDKPAKKPQPKPVKPVKPAPEPEPDIDWPIFDEAAELVTLVPIRRSRPTPRPAVEAPHHGRDAWVHLGYLIGFIIMAVYFYFR